MGKAKWQGIGFLLIIFTLAIGLSYLALSEMNTGIDDTDHKMSIALVNEDEGALFNDEYITFGDEFAKGINVDSKHDWYVVSRGVAESGFKRNNYDMLIVVPNDFSRKSLSIDEDHPEPVTLHYQINATGHKDVRAEAEKAAGKILNDFNKRLIDVYFASVIGNLQEAQDNINSIIDEEIDYTNEYYDYIHTPLSEYTGQFDRLQYYADNSKESYDNFENVLETFGERISDGVDTNQTFAQELDTIIEQKENNSVFKHNYQEYFNDYINNNLTQDNLNEQLKQLEKENSYVYDQFKKKEHSEKNELASLNESKDSIKDKDKEDKDEDKDKEDEKKDNLVNQTNDLQQFLEERIHEIGDLEEELYKEIYDNIEGVVEKGLSVSFEKDDRIHDLFPNVDENIHGAIQKQINTLPTLELQHEGSLLSKDIVKNMNRVIRVSNKYSEEFDFQPEITDDSNSFDTKINKIKEKLVNEGIVVTDTVRGVPITDNPKIEVTVPDQFKQVGSYEIKETTEENGTTNTVEISLHLKLKSDEKIDVFQPIEWTWKLNTKETEEQESKSKLEQIIKEEKEIDSEIDEANSVEDEEEMEPVENSEVASTTSKTTITNNYYKQKVQTQINTENMNDLLSEATELISEYYQLGALYDLYFDLDKNDKEKVVLSAVDMNKGLTEQASEDSLYYLVHKMEVKDALTKSVAGNISKQITTHVQDSMGELNEQMDQYKELIGSASKRTDKLISTMEKTRTHATDLNNQVHELLSGVTDWHETTSELADKQNEFVLSDDAVEMSIMNLDANYRPILHASESLKDQAKANFSVSDHVYQTIETLGKEADAIENSGNILVADANELADKLMDKAIEDADFADNFNDVLANSRVGDRQNDQLYEFLSNPVQTKNDGTITNSNSFIPYFIMLILFIMTLFTAYVFSNMGQKAIQQGPMAEDITLIGSNQSISLTVAGIGLVEGLIIGLLSFFLLDLGENVIYTWIGFIVLITMVMLLLMTYLLRQLKMIGMFVILFIFSIYLLLTKSLGFYFDNHGIVQFLRNISPLQYAENILRNVMEGEAFSVVLTFIFLIVLMGIGFFINLLVIQKGNEGDVNEETAEAN